MGGFLFKIQQSVSRFEVKSQTIKIIEIIKKFSFAHIKSVNCTMLIRLSDCFATKIYQVKFRRHGFDSDPPSSSEISLPRPSAVRKVIERKLLLVQTADVVDAAEVEVVSCHTFETSSLNKKNEFSITRTFLKSLKSFQLLEYS